MPIYSENSRNVKQSFRFYGLLFALLLLGVCRASGAELRVGQRAPNFALPDETGKIHKLSDYAGHSVVLMFYPKDFTPG